MPSDFTYELQEPAEAGSTRHAESTRQREREPSQLRASKDDERRDGILSRVFAAIERLSPASLRGSVISYEAHVLTDKVCHMADGSIGRVAIRESDGEWIEVCVPA